MASIRGNIPNIVFFSLTSSPQDIKKFNGFTSANFDASHKSIICERAKLLFAIFIIYCFSTNFVSGTYRCKKFIIAVDPFFDAICNAD
jgi:hypothetical protein